MQDAHRAPLCYIFTKGGETTGIAEELRPVPGEEFTPGFRYHFWDEKNGKSEAVYPDVAAISDATGAENKVATWGEYLAASIEQFH